MNVLGTLVSLFLYVNFRLDSFLQHSWHEGKLAESVAADGIFPFWHSYAKLQVWQHRWNIGHNPNWGSSDIPGSSAPSCNFAIGSSGVTSIQKGEPGQIAGWHHFHILSPSHFSLKCLLHLQRHLNCQRIDQNGWSREAQHKMVDNPPID